MTRTLCKSGTSAYSREYKESVNKRKAHVGQTEAVSMVLISGIVVSLVGAAYFWGMPLIEKRTSSTDFTSASNLMKDINSKIISLANAGGGELEIELSNTVVLMPAEAADPDNNSLTIIFSTSQPILYPGAGGGIIYPGASSFSDIGEESGVFGQSSPGVITVSQSVLFSGGYSMKTRLRYRPLALQEVQKTYIIKLCGETDLINCNNRASGSSKVILKFKGTETIQGTTGSTVVTKIAVKLV